MAQAVARYFGDEFEVLLPDTEQPGALLTSQRIADAVLDKFGVDAVTITVRKPSPIAGVLEHAGVRIRRERE